MSKRRIMIVDDHAPVLRVLRLGIEAAGFEVESACNGLDCIGKLQSGLPDFLVTDVDMPQMTGRELCEAIERDFPEREFPIVVLTSRTELEHRDWTRRMDNLAFMEKPVSVRRLVAHIEQRLGSSVTGELAS